MRFFTIAIVVIFASATAAGAQEQREQETAALAQSAAVSFSDPGLAVRWNEVVNEIAFAEDQFFTFKGVRAHAMMHLAMHDALNAVVPLYREYAYHDRNIFAHPVAAAAQAAHDVVLAQYPGAHVKLDEELAKWLAQVPDGKWKAHGIDLGRKTAAAILDMRAGDHWDFKGSYTFSTEIGAYQTTPPWDGMVLHPGFRFASPFGIRAPEQFRPAPPPGLSTGEYAEAYNEVKTFGRADSSVRTAEQTSYAVWWMEFTEGSLNRLARQLVKERRIHLWRATRLFALLNMSMFDGYLANWDSKYEFNHWRPRTAIREAARDGNAATEPDPAWETLRPTPPFPEYVSAHATVCSASFDIMARTFGDDLSFTMQTTTAPPEMPTRTFRRFSAAASECADSRIRLGWHFRYSTDRGLILGRQVATWVAKNHLTFRAGDPKQ